MVLTCTWCAAAHEACGVTESGRPVCWACYNRRLDEILAQLPELPTEESMATDPMQAVVRRTHELDLLTVGCRQI